MQRSFPAQPKNDDLELTKWRGHCLRLERDAINVGEKLYPPTWSSMVSMTLKVSVIAVNVLFLLPLAKPRLDSCPDPSIRDQVCVHF